MAVEFLLLGYRARSTTRFEITWFEMACFGQGRGCLRSKVYSAKTRGGHIFLSKSFKFKVVPDFFEAFVMLL